MKTIVTAVLLVLAAPFALTACQTESRTEIESDGEVDRGVEVTLDSAAADEAESDLEAAGAATRGALQDAAETVTDAAERTRDAIDSNVDLGENAENQGAD